MSEGNSNSGVRDDDDNGEWGARARAMSMRGQQTGRRAKEWQR